MSFPLIGNDIYTVIIYLLAGIAKICSRNGLRKPRFFGKALIFKNKKTFMKDFPVKKIAIVLALGLVSAALYDAGKTAWLKSKTAAPATTTAK